MGYGYGTTAEEHLLRVHTVVAIGLCASAIGVKLHLDGGMPGGDHMTIAQVGGSNFLGVWHVS